MAALLFEFPARGRMRQAVQTIAPKRRGRSSSFLELLALGVIEPNFQKDRSIHLCKCKGINWFL